MRTAICDTKVDRSTKRWTPFLPSITAALCGRDLKRGSTTASSPAPVSTRLGGSGAASLRDEGGSCAGARVIGPPPCAVVHDQKKKKRCLPR